MNRRGVNTSTPLEEADPRARTDIMSLSRGESELRGSISKKNPIESEKKSGNSDEYSSDALWPERFAGRVMIPWWHAKHNGRGRQWAQ